MNNIRLARAWALMVEGPASYFAEYDCPKEENPEYIKIKSVFGDLVNFEGNTISDLHVRKQIKSKEIANLEESYTTIFGEQRVGRKIDEGYWYLDSKLNIPIASNKNYKKSFCREDFECIEKHNVYRTVKSHVFGYINKTDKDLVLDAVTNKIYSISTGEIIGELKGDN